MKMANYQIFNWNLVIRFIKHHQQEKQTNKQVHVQTQQHTNKYMNKHNKKPTEQIKKYKNLTKRYTSKTHTEENN